MTNALGAMGSACVRPANDVRARIESALDRTDEMRSVNQSTANEGPAKNKSTDPARAVPPTHPLTHLPTFFFLGFFVSTFSGVLGKGSSKTRCKYFCKKSMSKTFPKKS
jgi:hypothetical protein